MTAISFLARNMLPFYQAVAAYLGAVLGTEATITEGKGQPEDNPDLLSGRVDVAFLCGLALTRLEKTHRDQLTPLVAPVLSASRYQDQPIYFSDIVVNAGSRFTALTDLVGTTFCFNEEKSNSGYNLLRHRLMKTLHGRPGPFFGKVICSESHQRSLQWIAEGQADCSAIDSTVLEQACRDDATLSEKLRVLESLGPAPMPPVAASRRIGSVTLERLRSALLQPNAELQRVMGEFYVRRFEAVGMDRYLVLRQLEEEARRHGYETIQ